MRLSVFLVGFVVALGGAPPAYAGDPIMPLSQVQRGMSCTAYSVVQGTDIAAFRADVVDVVSGGSSAQILVRVSGPAVDATGVGPGFSGSPIYCPDPQGTPRNIGAIAEGVGDYGNKLALVTPIEAILGEPVRPPAATRSARRLLRSAHPLAAPLIITGLPRGVARAVEAASRRAHHLVVPAAPAPSFGFAPQALRPGSAFAVGLSSGAIGLSAIGTVAYTDGATVWGFGHPLDGAGQRSLLLQDAYVYTVVNNPVGAADLSTYKLAAAGHDLGTVSNDAPDGVVGSAGGLPPLIPLTIRARDGDTGQVQSSTTQLSDETAVDQPAGASAVATVGPLAVASAAENLLRGMPANQSGSMCLRVSLRESARPLGFCNSYVEAGTGPGPSGTAIGAVESGMASDLSDAAALIDAYDVQTLHVTGLSVTMTLRRGLRQASILSAKAPPIVRPGSRLRVRLLVRRRRGPRQTIVVRARVPVGLRPGPQTLTLSGVPTDDESSTASAIPSIVAALTGSSTSGKPDTSPPESIPELAHAVAGIRRFDGVIASFGAPRRRGRTRASGQLVYRDPELRILGAAQVDLLVKPVRRGKRR
ncbi:MAG: hypothetical protein M3Z33_06155 [Actinomycetota bacterium]|nr:hypothetical protein [Actinomycetota bacterium]